MLPNSHRVRFVCSKIRGIAANEAEYAFAASGLLFLLYLYNKQLPFQQGQINSIDLFILVHISSFPVGEIAGAEQPF